MQITMHLSLTHYLQKNTNKLMTNQWNCPFYDDLKPDSFPKIQTINMFRERIK